MEFDILQAISQVGVPTALCAYVLLVQNKTVKENTQAIVDMRILLERLLVKGE